MATNGVGGNGPVPGERWVTERWPGVTTGTSSSGERFVFYCDADTPFSQHHPAVFEVKGQEYNCAEQYMMHQKAVLFGDAAIAKKILASKNPVDQQVFGRKVSNFDSEEWRNICRDIVKDGNRAKFSQNEELRTALLATEGSTIVEACVDEKVWGIGMNADNENCVNRSQWKGKNWMGQVITDVRDELLKGHASTKDFH